MYSSRLGRNCSGTDTYLPSSYSRSEYLFRTRSVATNLVTSQEFQRIRCAITLCHFGQTRNGYVATFFFLLSRKHFSHSVASISTSGFVVVPEHFGQNEEPAGRNNEQTRKKPSFVPTVDLIDTIVFQACNFVFQ